MFRQYAQNDFERQIMEKANKSSIYEGSKDFIERMLDVKNMSLTNSYH